jgi:hypothetical protein
LQYTYVMSLLAVARSAATVGGLWTRKGISARTAMGIASLLSGDNGLVDLAVIGALPLSYGR